MDSRILSFPHDPNSARRAGDKGGRRNDVSVAIPAAQNSSGPHLVYSRLAAYPGPFSLRAQANWIAQQVDWEMARRLERETAERHRNLASGLPYRGPMQAMEINTRQRLLDALLFFGRSA